MKYKIIQKYQMGYQDSMFVNVAIVTELAPTDKNGEPQTIVHAYEGAHLVLEDMSAHYRLPEHIALYRVQAMTDYDAFKKTGKAELKERDHLFMMNKNNGMWDTRWPDTPQMQRLYNRGFLATCHTTKWCVEQMLNQVAKEPKHAAQSYIRPVANNYPFRMASATICDRPADTKQQRLAERAFAHAMKNAPKTMVVRDIER